jgi:hypothetical protein
MNQGMMNVRPVSRMRPAHNPRRRGVASRASATEEQLRLGKHSAVRAVATWIKRAGTTGAVATILLAACPLCSVAADSPPDGAALHAVICGAVRLHQFLACI